ncbi:hypothetical protein BpHYR1_040658 [Brachionus plicatilis]|uniref:C2H2-type domain-containing protein n=1 Tax=Brachionus plicatilis TaxID=10195 RepID=A0A3M7RMU7_BRAPC|nr:hypothetical protein BpHYR1_040658 [Brachionus plicatilis]
MSNDQENFLAYQTNPVFSMQNADDFYKMMNFFKYFLNGANEPKQDFLNLFLYQCQYQLQNQLCENAIEKHQPNLRLQESSTKAQQTDQASLSRDSMEKILSSNENKPVVKPQSKSECTGSEAFKHHLKQASSLKRSVAGGNEAMLTHKMVRGQEEWVNNSRNNNFISQILKCLECSASFDTLDDLSLHMLKFNHFSRFHPNQAPQRPLSPKQKAKTPFALGKLQKNAPVSPDLARSKNSVSPRASADAKNFSCKICKKNLHEQSSLPPLIELIQHLKNNHQIDFICTNCGEFFYSEKDLNEHLVEFHQFGSVPQKKNKVDQEKKETKTMSCSLPSLDSREKLNHPLLALQMFVNGASELDGSFECKIKNQNQNNDSLPQKSVNKQNLDLASKLPAKKRPYIKTEENHEENDFAKSKRPKNDEDLRELCNDRHPNLTQINNTYQPLNLLQNMRMNIDNYFTR